MSANAVESTNAQPVTQTHNNKLIYRLEDRPPLVQTLFVACQHLLAMFAAMITPVLLICQALGLPVQDTQHIISMLLFASDATSIIQIKAWGSVGSGSLSIQGTSSSFVAPLVMGSTALKADGVDAPTMMAALFGTLMLVSCTEMIISRVLHLARRIITSLVSGVVVMIINLSLIQVGLTSIDDGHATVSGNTFGASRNLLLTGAVLALIILLNRQCNPYLRVMSLVIAMVTSYLLAWFMGMLPQNTAPVSQDLLMVPMLLHYGLGIDWSLLLLLMPVFMITPLEIIGDITVTSDVSEQPVSGPLYVRRLKGGVLANDPNLFVSAVFNIFPNSCFGQNNGVIQLTGVTSRYVGSMVALMLIAPGLLLTVSDFVQYIPEPILGDTTLVMFGIIAASGIRIVSCEPLNHRAILITALSSAVSLGVSRQPLILQFTLDWVRDLLSSGIAAGGITAIVLNLVLPLGK